MYVVLKALSFLDGAKKYHKDSTPKLTDTILSIKVSDVNAYFGKSDEFCISAKKKPHPPDGDAADCRKSPALAGLFLLYVV